MDINIDFDFGFGIDNSIKISLILSLIGTIIYIVSTYLENKKYPIFYKIIKNNNNRFKYVANILFDYIAWSIVIFIGCFVSFSSLIYLILNSYNAIESYGFVNFIQEKTFGLRLLNILALLRLLGGLADRFLESTLYKIKLSNNILNPIISFLFGLLFGIVLEQEKKSEQIISSDTIKTIDFSMYSYYIFAISCFWLISSIEVAPIVNTSLLFSALLFLITFIFDDWGIVSKYAKTLKGYFEEGEVKKIRIFNWLIGLVVVILGFSSKNLITGILILIINILYLLLTDLFISQRLNNDIILAKDELLEDIQEVIDDTQIATKNANYVRKLMVKNEKIIDKINEQNRKLMDEFDRQLEDQTDSEPNN